MMRFRVGVASAAGARAMARYIGGETLQQTPEQIRLAKYFAAEKPDLTPADGFARLVRDGGLSYSEAEAALTLAALRRPENRDADPMVLEDRAAADLKHALDRLDGQQNEPAAPKVPIEVMAGLEPGITEVLGLTGKSTLSEEEFARFLDALRADTGGPLGKQQQTPMISVAEAFGLDEKAPPQGEQLRNVLAGLRADGSAPYRPDGEMMADKAIEGARRRFLTMMQVPADREPTEAEVEHLARGLTAAGRSLPVTDYRRGVTATKAPVAYVEMVFAPDKSVSVAWALAPTEAERQAWRQVHDEAVDGALAHARSVLGHAGIGKGRSGGTEPAELGGVKVTHFTSRPTVETVAHDREGRPYTVPQEVPVPPAPQLHSHSFLANLQRTESGRLVSLDLDLLAGRVKEIGGVYQALVAKGARSLGAEVVMNERTGAARLPAIPDRIRALYTPRHDEGVAEARKYAAANGLDWDGLDEAHKRALLDRGIIATKRAKVAIGEADGESNFAVWQKRALDKEGYQHRAVVRPDEIRPELEPAQRHELAYQKLLPILGDALSRSAKISAGDFGWMVSTSLIKAGVDAKNPGADIAAVTKMAMARGVMQDGRLTRLVIGEDAPVRGKERVSVSTTLHADQEERLIALAKKAHADHSLALSLTAIGRAIDRSGLDLSSEPEHGQKQREMMERMATGPALVVAIGAAGSGKTTILRPVIDAWKAAGEGRTVYGAALAWRQASPLVGAGVDAGNKAAIDPFLKGAESGKYALDAKSLVVIDELGQLGTRQLLRLLELQDRHGFKIVAVGDPAQCAAIEAGPVISLVQRALGKDAVPEIVTTVRQQHEGERKLAALWREGRAEEALAIKQDDGTAILVAGGRERTVNKVADLWAERMAVHKADPDFRLTVTTRSNENVLALGQAIRAKQRELGLIGEDAAIWKAADRAGQKYDLPLAVGDRVRVFDRIYTKDANGKRVELVSNGDVAEVRSVSKTELLVRNDAGLEGAIRREKIEGKDGRARLIYGTALTIDAAQGLTSTMNINAIIDGTAGITSNKNYVAESRHVVKSIMVIDEWAERREVNRRQPIGAFKDIREPDIWANVARNLSRQPEKATAAEFVAGALEKMRAATRGLQLGEEPTERRLRMTSPDSRGLVHGLSERRRMTIPHVVERVRKITHRIAHEGLHPIRRVQMPDRGIERVRGIDLPPM